MYANWAVDISKFRSLYFDSPCMRDRQNIAELIKIFSDIVHQNMQ